MGIVSLKVNPMNGLDGQTLAALICVILAVVVMGRWTIRWWRGQSIGGCGACASGCGKPEPPQLMVTLPIVEAPEMESTTESK